MRKSKIIVLNLLAAVLFSFAANAASAQNSSAALTPASIDTTVKAGSSYTQTFTLTNGGSVPMRFKGSVADVGYDDQNRRVDGRAGTMERSASLWIQFTPAEVIVPAFGSAVVKAVITVPSTATGSFYTVPIFEGIPVAKTQIVIASTSTASIGVRFRGLIMLTTERGSEYNVEIMDAKFSPTVPSGEIELNLDLRNRGTAYAKTRTAYAILNSSGKLIAHGGIPEKRLLPGQRNTVKGKWAGTLPSGNYTCVVTVSYNRVGLEPISLVQEIPFTVK